MVTTLFELDLTVIVLVFGAMALAGLVHGSLGLGFPMVATPIVAVTLDVRTAIILTLLPTITVNIASIVGSKGYGDSLRRYRVLIGAVIVGSVLGAWILAIADPSPFRLALALLVLLFLWTSHAQRLPRELFRAQPLAAMLTLGVAAGISAGTTNVMVAVLIIYFLALDVARSQMVPVLNTCFMIGKVSQIVILSLAGFVTLTAALETTPLAVTALVSLLIGQRLRDHIPVETYRKLLHVLLAILALILLVQFGNDIIA